MVKLLIYPRRETSIEQSFVNDTLNKIKVPNLKFSLKMLINFHRFCFDKNGKIRSIDLTFILLVDKHKAGYLLNFGWKYLS